MRQRVYLLFGGRSSEHEVSLMSAKNVYGALDKTKYDVQLIGIAKDGTWYLIDDAAGAFQRGPGPGAGIPVSLVPYPNQPSLHMLGSVPPGVFVGQGEAVFFPVLHGTNGEDGTIQGLLELANVPYVGCGVLASAAGMDKSIAKALFAQARIPTVPGVTVLRCEWDESPDQVMAHLTGQLPFPVFVKPCNLGSSVGVSKAKDSASLAVALKNAFMYDRKVLVEMAVNAREVELAVLGNDRAVVSMPGEIIPGDEFYSYEDKYVNGVSTSRIPADLSPSQVKDLQRYAITAFRALDGSGLARVDFFVGKEDGRIWLNEVNTLPGFTAISMYPQLMAAAGMDYRSLCDRMIVLGMDRWKDRQRNQYTV